MKVSNDQHAIIRLDETFELQRKAYFNNSNPDLETRLAWLERIPAMMMQYADRIADALNEDYGYHNRLTAYLFDVLNVAERAGYAMANLKSWMARDYREMETAIYGDSRAYIDYQPKGVIGNLPAWNFPVDLSVGPLVEMLAAGNRVIIKPSEQVPAVGEVLAEMLGEHFDRDHVWVVNGKLDLARHFSSLPWNHLLYTGNATIGREVMLKAAENLVPVTLELGGKNPTVFTEEAVNEDNVRTMLGSKLCKNGQLCITVDHVYVPESQLQKFTSLVRDVIESTMGDYTNSPMMGCAVINRRQRDRVQGYIDDARERVPGSVIEIGSPAHAEGPNRMPLTLVVNPPQEALLCQHEIFGPVLPIHTYGDFDEVVEKIKTGERPLGVYIFSNNPDRIEQLRRNSSSGGFTVNGPSMQGALASLGFGGVGKSGMGRHHGIEGFREFSNPRGIVEIADNANLDPILTPHGESSRQLIAAATNGFLGRAIE